MLVRVFVQDGWTALMYAVELDDDHYARALVRAGADVDVENEVRSMQLL